MTDDIRDDDLRRFFHDRVVPAAESLRERDVRFFPLAPDVAQSSYWTARPRGESYVFQIGDDVEGELHELWRDYPELRALAHDLATMTRAMAERREQTADVSSFIYAMF